MIEDLIKECSDLNFNDKQKEFLLREFKLIISEYNKAYRKGFVDGQKEDFKENTSRSLKEFGY